MKAFIKLNSNIKKELNHFKGAGLSKLLNLNLEFAGAAIDLNELISLGWQYQIKMQNNTNWLTADDLLIEYIWAKDDSCCEHRAVLSFGSPKCPDFTKTALRNYDEGEYDEGLTGEGYRWAYYRWLRVYSIDTLSLELKEVTNNCPHEIFNKIQNDLLTTKRINTRCFSDDLKFQGELFEPIKELENCSAFELDLLKFAKCFESQSLISQSKNRLLCLFTKAIFTDNDPKGREALLSLKRADTILLFCEYFTKNFVAELSVAFFMILISIGEVEINLKSAEQLTLLAYALLECGMPSCANALIKMIHSNNDLLDSALSSCIFKCVVKQIKRNLEDKEKINHLYEIFRLCCSINDYGVEYDMLNVLLLKYLNLKDDTQLEKALDNVLARAHREYDEECDFSEEEWRKTFPLCVKNPTIWQAYFSIKYHEAFVKEAIKALPNAISSEINSIFPETKVIMGLPLDNLWKWLLPEADDKELSATKEMINSKIASFTSKKPYCFASFNEIVDAPFYPERRLIFDEDQTNELSGVAIEGVYRDEIEKTETIMIMPFLPVNSPTFSDNIIASAWKYYPWLNAAIAEVEVTIEGGEVTDFFAIMPYYIEDKKKLPKGLRAACMICGFANSIKRESTPENFTSKTFVVNKGPLAEENGGPVELGISPDFFDTFEQDLYRSEFSKSGFVLHGKFISMRITKAFGIDVACVTLGCVRLPFELRVYIALSKFDLSLKEGDRVEVEGWLYIDFTQTVDDTVYFANIFSKICTHEPTRKNSDKKIINSIRTSYPNCSDKMKELIVQKTSYKAFFYYAKKYLETRPDVYAVVTCDENMTGIDFIVFYLEEEHYEFFAFNVVNEGDILFSRENLRTLYAIKKQRYQRMDIEWKIV